MPAPQPPNPPPPTRTISRLSRLSADTQSHAADSLEVLRISVRGILDLPRSSHEKTRNFGCFRRKSEKVWVCASEIAPTGNQSALPAHYVVEGLKHRRDGHCVTDEDAADRFIELNLEHGSSRKIRFDVHQYRLQTPSVAFAEVDILDLCRKPIRELQLSDPVNDQAVYGDDRRRPVVEGEHPYAHYRRPCFLRIKCWVVRYGIKAEKRHSTPERSITKTSNTTGEFRSSINSTTRRSGKTVMIFTRGTRGDVQPFAALARGLAKPPHNCRVIVVTEVCWRKFIHDCRRDVPNGRISFRPSGGNTMKRVNDSMAQWVLSAGSTCDALQVLVLARTEAEFFPSEGLFFHWAHVEKPDFIVYGFTQTNIAMIVSEALNIPIVGFILQPAKGLELRASPNNVMDELFGPVREIIGKPEFTAALQQVMEKVPGWKSLNPYRRTRGLFPCPHDITNEDKHTKELIQQKIPRIVPISPLVMGKEAEKVEELGMTLTDFIFLRLGNVDQLSPDLESFIANARAENRQVVLLTFSSMPVGELRLLSIAVDICKNCQPPVNKGEVSKAPAFIALCGGQGFAPPTPSLEEEVQKLEEAGQLKVLRKGAPFGTLFPAVDVIMLHGGLGVTSEAILAGKPVVTSGVLLMDQRFWAARMEELGCGSAGIPVDDMAIQQEDGNTIAVNVLNKALDARTDAGPTWIIRARELKNQIENMAGGADSDGVSVNAAAVFEAGTGPQKEAIVKAYDRQRGFFKSCCRQFLCFFMCCQTCLTWCLCSQIPGCVKLWLRIWGSLWRCICCKPVENLFLNMFAPGIWIQERLQDGLDKSPGVKLGNMRAGEAIHEQRADFEEMDQENQEFEEIIIDEHSYYSAQEDLRRAGSNFGEEGVLENSHSKQPTDGDEQQIMDPIIGKPEFNTTI